MKATELDDLITQAEAARLRGVTREAVYDLVARGRLSAVEIGGKKFVRRSEVEGFEMLPAGRPPDASRRETTTDQPKRQRKAKGKKG